MMASRVDRPASESSLGREIRRARQALGLTQGQLAARLGVNRVAVTHWERDVHRPSDTNLRLLSEVLDHVFAPVSAPGDCSPLASAGVADRVSLLEMMSPSYRRGRIGVFESRAVEDAGADMLIGREIMSYLDHTLVLPRSGATSAVLVRGDKLMPAYADSDTMVLADGASLVPGNDMLILGCVENASRRARYGELVHCRAEELVLSRLSSGEEENIQYTECDAIFRVVR